MSSTRDSFGSLGRYDRADRIPSERILKRRKRNRMAVSRARVSATTHSVFFTDQIVLLSAHTTLVFEAKLSTTSNRQRFQSRLYSSMQLLLNHRNLIRFCGGQISLQQHLFGVVRVEQSLTLHDAHIISTDTRVDRVVHWLVQQVSGVQNGKVALVGGRRSTRQGSHDRSDAGQVST